MAAREYNMNNPALPVLTSAVLRELQTARPELADDCARALRRCRNTRSELAMKLGMRVEWIPAAPLEPGYARSGRWTDATGAGKITHSNR